MTIMNETRGKDNRQAVLAEANRRVERVEQAYERGEAVHELERGLFTQLLRIRLSICNIVGDVSLHPSPKF